MDNQVINDTTITIPTTAKLISPAVFNGKRTSIAITNTSLLGETITIAFGTEAKITSGIPLKPNDRFIDSSGMGYQVSNNFITAIASAVTGTIALHEVITLE